MSERNKMTIGDVACMNSKHKALQTLADTDEETRNQSILTAKEMGKEEHELTPEEAFDEIASLVGDVTSSWTEPARVKHAKHKDHGSVQAQARPQIYEPLKGKPQGGRAVDNDRGFIVAKHDIVGERLVMLVDFFEGCLEPVKSGASEDESSKPESRADDRGERKIRREILVFDKGVSPIDLLNQGSIQLDFEGDDNDLVKPIARFAQGFAEEQAWLKAKKFCELLSADETDKPS